MEVGAKWIHEIKVTVSGLWPEAIPWASGCPILRAGFTDFRSVDVRRRLVSSYLLRSRVHPQTRLPGLNDHRPLLAAALHAKAQPRLLHAQEQFSQRRVFGVRSTQPACSRGPQEAPIGQIQSSVMRNWSGTRLLDDETVRTTTPALPTNRDLACKRKNIIHQCQAADAADLALGAFEQDGDHAGTPSVQRRQIGRSAKNIF
jgi:hypothetical protein